ncbi:hypothetical protein ACX3OY_17595 [Citrobacter farmeri]
MNTITKEFTKEQLIKRLEEQESSARYALSYVQDSEILQDIEIDLRITEIARASLTAEPIGAFHISDQQVEGTSDYIKDGEWPINNGVIEVYTTPPVPSGYVIVPKCLTAENGAKGVMIGEFSETKFINCPECFGDGDCETCDGSGRIKISVSVSWTNIKAIWAKGVEHFAAVPQQEVDPTPKK